MAVIALAVVSALPLDRANASANYSVAATTPVSGGAVFIAADQANNMVYVSGQTSDTVTVIDGSTNAVVTTISLAGDAEGIAVNQATNRIYVANEQTGTLTVIDGSKNVVTGTISLPVSSPFYVAVNPHTNTIYVLTHPNQLAFVNGTNNTVMGSITIGNIYNTGWIAVNPITNTVYVVATHNAAGGGGMLTVIDGATNTVAKQVAFGGDGFYVSVNPTTNTVYATGGGEVIYVFDGSTNTQTGTISVGAPGVSGVSVNPATNTVFGTSLSNPGQLYVIDGASFTLLQTITLGNTPFDLSVNANTNTVYVANEVGGTVSVVSETTPTAGIALNNMQSTSGTVSSPPYQFTLSSFNVGSGSNRLLVVGVSANNNYVLSITFGGVQLAQAVSSMSNNDAEFWYLVNPTGTGDIVVTFAGPTAAVVGAYALSGVSQTSPIPTTAANHNTAAGSPSVSISTQYPNSWVLDLPSIWGGVTLGSPSCTQQWDANVPNEITGASSSTTAASPGTVTCGWTASGGDLWDDVAIEIAPSG